MAVKRQQIIDAIITRLKDINGAGAYYLDVADRVFDTRETPFDKDTEIPSINVTDGDEQKGSNPPEYFAGPENIWYRDMTVNVELVTNGTFSAADIRKGIADIEYAMSQEPQELTLGGLAVDIDWTGTHKNYEPDQPEKKVMSVTVTFQIRFTTYQYRES